MRRNIVGLVWLVGIVLTIIVYQIGPDRIVWAGFGWLRDLRAAFDALAAALALNTFDLMRALTIGLFPVFILLGLLAHRRGLPVRSPLVLVTFVFVLLLIAPLRSGEPISDVRWIGAFVVVLAGSVTLTRRLMVPESRAQPWPGQPQSGQPHAGRPPGGPSPWPTPPR